MDGDPLVEQAFGVDKRLVVAPGLWVLLVNKQRSTLENVLTDILHGRDNRAEDEGGVVRIEKFLKVFPKRRFIQLTPPLETIDDSGNHLCPGLGPLLGVRRGWNGYLVEHLHTEKFSEPGNDLVDGIGLAVRDVLFHSRGEQMSLQAVNVKSGQTSQSWRRGEISQTYRPSTQSIPGGRMMSYSSRESNISCCVPESDLGSFGRPIAR